MLAATIVAPGRAMVVPLMPEFIVKQDGAEKPDCERNAAKRWLATHSERMAPLKPIYLGDDRSKRRPTTIVRARTNINHLTCSRPGMPS
jgi:hypothetical protein